MTYQVKFTFFDGKEVPVNIEEDELDSFVDCMGENKVYYTKDKKLGFWIAANQVRYFNIVCLENSKINTQQTFQQYKEENQNEKTIEKGQDG